VVVPFGATANANTTGEILTRGNLWVPVGRSLGHGEDGSVQVKSKGDESVNGETHPS